MKTKLFSLIALACLLVGCSTTSQVLSTSVVKGAVSAATSFGLEQHPEASPYVALSADVICAAANSTNVEPANIVATLQGMGVGDNPYAKLIINSIVAIYNGVFDSYGNAWVQNKPALAGYLKAVCDGIVEGLPSPNPTLAARREKPLPPHLQ